MSQQRAIARALKEQQTEVIPDRVVCRADGTIEVCRYYYYRPCHPLDWGVKVVNVLRAMGFDVELRCADDRFRPWPQESFLRAVIQPRALD